jgi:hypothetical protein
MNDGARPGLSFHIINLPASLACGESDPAQRLSRFPPFF